MKNLVITEGNVARIQIIRKSGEQLETLIDLSDLPKVVEQISGSLSISANPKVSKMLYAATWGGGSMRYLHRVITDAPKGLEVDHINRNGLDNRRRNLRVVDRPGNLKNRLYEHARYAQAKHYRWVPYRGVFVAQINIGGVPFSKSSVNEDVIIEWVAEMREKQRQVRLEQLPKAA